MKKADQIMEVFNNPPAKYRSVPFWSWNDRLDAKELARQAESMKEQGMGGFFMHSREGLETPYLGEEWMDCVRAVVDTAEMLGMSAWLYDEDRWPSGAAGGRVPRMGGDAFRAKAVTIEICPQYKTDEKTLAVYCARLSGNFAEGLRRVYSECGERGESYLILRREVAPASEWFGGDAPADNLNPDCVAAFIETTYEAYRKQVGYAFGKTVTGVFTDEPNVADTNAVYPQKRGWIPWTDGFDEYFEKKHGYDIFSRLPLLFFYGEGAEKMRHDYWRTVAERFCEAYTMQISHWCKCNGLMFTGHYLFESDLGWGTRSCGAIMPNYVHQDIPGIDMLCNATHEVLTVKQCTSVANQFGKPFVISEMYGCTGWEFTFEDQKRIGDWQFVLGVNLRSQHLALYSIKGCRKRDYPPSFNYNNCWWPFNRRMEDYFARIAAVTSEGRAVRDVLVLHPQSTVWAMLGSEPEDKSMFDDISVLSVNRYGDAFNEFLKGLLNLHYDFDLGDETLLAESGSAEQGALRLGAARYKLVIVPPGVKTMLRSTVELLRKHLELGGKVIAFTPLPDMVEGEADNEDLAEKDGKLAGLAGLFEHHGCLVLDDESKLGALLEAVLPREVDIRDRHGYIASDVWYLYKQGEGFRSLFLVNNDRTKACECMVTLRLQARIDELDPFSGNVCERSAEPAGEGMRFAFRLEPSQSRLFLLREDQPVLCSPQIIAPRMMDLFHPKKLLAALGPSFAFYRTEPNVLVLDKCRYSVDGSAYSEPMLVWKAQRLIRDLLGMRQVYYNGLEQRYRWVDKPHPSDGAEVSLRFNFWVRDIPKNDVYLAIEEASEFTVVCNGISVTGSPQGWYRDRSIGKWKLPTLVEGENELIVTCSYKRRTEFEDCFLLGDFGVSRDAAIIREPDRLYTGDWCLQGYPFYSGNMVYSFDVTLTTPGEGRARLYINRFSGVAALVRVNGREAGFISYAGADGLDVTDCLQTGLNRIDIEVVGSCRNTFGPLHLSAKTAPMTNWCSFRSEGDNETQEYVLEPYGLLEQVVILWE